MVSRTEDVGRKRSLRIRDIGHGPWEVIVPLWVLAAVVVAIWISQPGMRIPAVGDWRLAAFTGATLAGLIAMRTAYLIYAGHPLRHVVALGGTLLGAVVMGLAGAGPLRPETAQASACAPSVFVQETAVGSWVSYLLPIALWLVWCGYLILHFPRIEKLRHMSLGSRESRFHAYSRALKRLPARVLVTVVWIVLFLAGVNRWHGPVSDDASAVEIVEALVSKPATVARRDPLFTRVEEDRQRAQRRALGELDDLSLDAARPNVGAAVCDLLLPGYQPRQRLVAAEKAFRRLDRELNAVTGSWQPSAEASGAILELLPFNPESESTRPVCPRFWPSSVPEGFEIQADRLSDLKRTQSTVIYRDRSLVKILLTALEVPESSPVTVEVAMKIVGRAGEAANLASIVEARLGRPPSVGPITIGFGALCAEWDLGRIGLRVGPAVAPGISDRQMTPDSQLWITCFDSSLVGALRPLYERRGGGPSWDPHHCSQF